MNWRWYDPRILAGMYEAAWNKELTTDRTAATFLKSIVYSPVKGVRQKLVSLSQEEAKRRVDVYVKRTWSDYNGGVID